jgi:hypothetical protein
VITVYIKETAKNILNITLMMTQSTSKKRQGIRVIVGMIALVLAFYGVQQFFKTDIEAELARVALELNKRSPIQFDEFTRLDSASAQGATNFSYYYTLTKVDKKEVHSDSVQAFLKPTLIHNIKYNPELKVYRDHEITMDYHYYGKNGDFIIKIAVTPELYKD